MLYQNSQESFMWSFLCVFFIKSLLSMLHMHGRIFVSFSFWGDAGQYEKNWDLIFYFKILNFNLLFELLNLFFYFHFKTYKSSIISLRGVYFLLWTVVVSDHAESDTTSLGYIALFLQLFSQKERKPMRLSSIFQQLCPINSKIPF